MSKESSELFTFKRREVENIINSKQENERALVHSLAENKLIKEQLATLQNQDSSFDEYDGSETEYDSSDLELTDKPDGKAVKTSTEPVNSIDGLIEEIIKPSPKESPFMTRTDVKPKTSTKTETDKRSYNLKLASDQGTTERIRTFDFPMNIDSTTCRTEKPSIDEQFSELIKRVEDLRPGKDHDTNRKASEILREVIKLQYDGETMPSHVKDVPSPSHKSNEADPATESTAKKTEAQIFTESKYSEGNQPKIYYFAKPLINLKA